MSKTTMLWIVLGAAAVVWTWSEKRLADARLRAAERQADLYKNI